MEIIYKTIVGSKMHGLDTPKSDEDVRYITRHSLLEVLSPFKNDTIKVEGSSSADVESWELRHFVKHLTSGNPTCYEVIKSDLYDRSYQNSEQIRGLMPLCYDGVKILMAHCGYAEAQLKRYLRKAALELQESNEPLACIWDENIVRRVPKAIVAAYRVLAQGKQLLYSRDFCPRVKDYSNELHEKLMLIKEIDPRKIDKLFINLHLEEIEEGIKELKAFYETLDDSSKYSKPQIDRIEQVLSNLYGVPSMNTELPNHTELHEITFYYENGWVFLVLTSWDDVNWTYCVKDDGERRTIKTDKTHRSKEEAMEIGLNYMKCNGYKPVIKTNEQRPT